jgi:hypothetical protein
MSRFLQMFTLVLALSVVGMPSGMARMMGGHQVWMATHEHHQPHIPQKQAPHAVFMVCAACVGVDSLPVIIQERLPLSQTIVITQYSAPDGFYPSPLLPPPRS